MTEGRDHYVVTSCSDCLVRVTSHRGEQAGSGWIDINYISAHDERHYGRWRNRTRNAWRVLRNDYSWMGACVDSREVAEALRQALSEAIQESWPDRELPPTASGL